MRARELGLLVASTLLLTGGLAGADTRRVGDADDLAAKVDVKWVAHDHGKRHRIVQHGLRTYGRWKDRALRGYRIRLELNTNKSNAYERIVRIEYRDGRLRAKMFKGKYMDVKVPGRIRLWRPNKRTVWVSFGAGMLRSGIRRYRWAVTVYERGLCPGSCPSDSAPENGWVRHRL